MGFPTAAQAASLANLMPSHVGSTAQGFGTKDCSGFPGILSTEDGWHFVLPAAEGDSFISITLTFSGGVVGPITSTNSAAPSTGPGWSGYIDNAGPDFKHAYVKTSPVGQTLLGGTAQITPDGKVGSTFNLSHTCPGTSQPSPSASPSPMPSVTTSPLGNPVTSPPGTVATTPAGTPSGSTGVTPAPSGGAETGAGGSQGITFISIGALALAAGAGAALFMIRRRDDLA